MSEFKENRFFQCSKGHTYQTTSANAVKLGCPICKGKLIKPKSINFEGKEYSNLRDLALHMGVDLNFLRHRLRQGFNPHEVLEIFNSRKTSRISKYKSWSEHKETEKRIKQVDPDFNPVSTWVDQAIETGTTKWTQEEKTNLRNLAKEGLMVDSMALSLRKSPKQIVKMMHDLDIFEGHVAANLNYLQKIVDEASEKITTKRAEVGKITPGMVRRILEHDEDATVEYKATYSFCLNSQKSKNEDRMHDTLKAIAGFANGQGGKLIIGINDKDKSIIGLRGYDYDGNSDKFINNIGNKINDCLSQYVGTLVEIQIVEIEKNSEVCVVIINQSNKPVYCRHRNKEDFYVRQNGRTESLKPSSIVAYISDRFS